MKTITFPGSDEAQLSQIGGKAFSLLRGSNAGLPVPPGFVLPVEFFSPWLNSLKGTQEWSTFLSAQPEHLKTACDDLKRAALALTFDAEQKDALKTAINNGENRLFAVRSSSPEEDLEGTSFAGGYETILGVTAATLEDAIKRGFVSCLDFRIVAYKREHGFDVTDPKIAVVVQEQIASEIAGVGFSLNPLTNNYDEAVFNANWGLGESVVSGAVTPDTYVVDKITEQVKQERAGTKELSIWLTPSGGTVEKPNQNGNELCLDEAQILRLTLMLKCVEELYERPVDIEWAFCDGSVYLLQARPITAFVPLSREMQTDPGQEKRLYLDVTISVQGIFKPISPMGASLLKGVFRRVSDKLFGFGDPFKNADTAVVWIDWGRLYLNLSNFISILGREPISKLLSNMDPLALKTIEQLDLSVYLPEKRRHFQFPWKLLYRLPIITPHLAEAFMSPDKAHLRVHSEIRKFMRSSRELERSTLKVWDLADDLLLRTVKLVITQSAPLFIASRVAREEMKSLAGQENETLLNKVDRALPNNVTTEMGLALYDMSQLRPGSTEYDKAWAEFVEQYGHRGPVELDIASPRYRDKPQMLLDQIEMLRKSATEQDNPRRRFDETLRERQKAYDELLEKVRKKGWIQANRFSMLYKVWENLSGYREMHKYCLIFALDVVRDRLLREAEKLVAGGSIDTREQIFDLTMDDLRKFAGDSKYDLRVAAQKNRAPHDRLAKVPQLPALIDSRGLILRPQAGPAGEGEVIGTPISPGVARGKIKVLHAPDEKPLLRGEIMVARATDPGWTPLFVNASAVVLEVGGMLQHGALVAREYGLPCVSGIPGATELWEDGTEVEVDGSAGVIRIVEG